MSLSNVEEERSISSKNQIDLKGENENPELKFEMQHENCIDDNRPIPIKPVNHRSHAVHSCDDISEIGFEKMMSVSEPAAVPRPEVSLGTPVKEMSRKNSMDYVSAKKKY